MSFLIFRTKKLKSFGEISGSLSHNYRTRETPNANPQETPKNEHSHQSADEVLCGIKDRIPQKVRKNGVLCIETLMTASPEWQGWHVPSKEAALFEKSKTWLIEKFGAENVIATSIHRDETTPHLVAYIVPLDLQTNKLNARRWLGGRTKLSQLQTDYHQAVTQHDQDFGLRRGIVGSKAKHTTIQQFYSQIQAPVVPNQVFEHVQTKIQPISNPVLAKPLDSQLSEPAWIASVIYKDVASQVDEIHAQYQQAMQDMKNAYAHQLKVARIEVDKERDAHHCAIRVIEDEKLKVEVLQKELKVFREYKKFFPQEYVQFEAHIQFKLQEHQKALDHQHSSSAKSDLDHSLTMHQKQLKQLEDQRIASVRQRFEHNIEHANNLAEKQVHIQNYDNWQNGQSSDVKQAFKAVSETYKSTPFYVLLKQLVDNHCHEAFLDEQTEALQTFKPEQVFARIRNHIAENIKMCRLAEQYLYQRQFELPPERTELNKKIETLRTCVIQTEEMLREKSFAQDVERNERQMRNEAHVQEVVPTLEKRPQPKISHDQDYQELGID
ncbi:MobV family relaxase [Acinetobacter nectaris]|uniref:MobV family relaxase n=1 Tax=Acinetobacter nectaris TaxID=1219382 RepID=UPI001F29E0CA|nr:MobV family relaxase [Acinetobacter nectaris]MCF9047378.1 plasmid recombination protein [Acinetobacter nectaris]